LLPDVQARSARRSQGDRRRAEDPRLPEVQRRVREGRGARQAPRRLSEGRSAMARLQEKYTKEIVPAMMKKFQITNRMAVPRLKKITVSMGVGKATQEKKRIDVAAKELGLITGQKPVITKARKSVAGFKLRQGMPIGCSVTLRGRRMYEFLDRLI